MNTVRGIGGSFSSFHSEIGAITVAAFATIFTWGFIQGLKNNVLTPVIQAYIIPEKTRGLSYELRDGKHTLKLGKFLAELIQWLVFMALLFSIWSIGYWRRK